MVGGVCRIINKAGAFLTGRFGKTVGCRNEHYYLPQPSQSLLLKAGERIYD